MDKYNINVASEIGTGLIGNVIANGLIMHCSAAINAIFVRIFVLFVIPIFLTLIFLKYVSINEYLIS